MTWFITGNANIDPTKFLGTINDQPLIIKTNQLADNSEKMRINPDGNVAIGKAPGAYKLDIEGVINATDIHKNGAPLSVSQWEDVAGGITYGGGAVGIGKAPSTSYKLDVAGTFNATDIHKNGVPLVGSQWKGVTGGINYGGGRVGIGTPTPNARLSVVGPGAAEIGGTTRSLTLLSSAGRLGATAGNELALASIGFATVNNNVSLGIRGHRVADGPDWPTTAIGLGMDVDDTVRAGASLWLHANGNVGIGTPAPTARLDVSGDMKVAGTLRWGKSIANPDSIELGAPDSSTPGVGTPFIDFHFQGLTQDFNTRIINDADGQLTISAGRLRALGSVAISGNATVGAGSNGVLKVRHVDGKHFQNDNNDALFLNWSTGQPVVINRLEQPGALSVYGSGHFSAFSAGSGDTYGLQATVGGTGTGWKYGIYANVSGDGVKFGGRFIAESPGNDPTYGTQGHAKGPGTGTKIGVYGSVEGNGQKYAGYFNGNVHINGTLSKSAGAFLIDHPEDPYNKTLRHNFVESPENLCLYRGKVELDADGKATVRMPDYFAALTKEDEATVYLTPIGEESFPTSYRWEEEHTSLTVFGSARTEVAYLVLADRDDPAIRLLSRPVEEEKGEGIFEKGKLLNPEAFDEPEDMGIAPQLSQPEVILEEPAQPT